MERSAAFNFVFLVGVIPRFQVDQKIRSAAPFEAAPYPETHDRYMGQAFQGLPLVRRLNVQGLCGGGRS